MITIQDIQKTIIDSLSLADDFFESRSRKLPIIKIRYIAIHIARELGFTLPAIGSEFGRNHSSIINGLAAFDDLIAIDSDYKNLYFSLKNEIIK